MSQSKPRPFTLSVPEGDISDLKERLARTRWPDEPPLAPWSTGASLAYVKGLADYWRTEFDWRAWETKLNGFRQFTVPIGGIDLHFIHEPGRGPNPIPLLISHGWPGSVFEFHDLIHRLTDRFTVIAPSLPGYTLSFKPGQERFGAEEIADLYAELMTGVLGYEKFAYQGGDWGAFVGSILGYRYPERLIGLHLNFLAVRRDPSLVANPTPEEKAFLDELSEFLKEETGYQWIQGTRPQTLAFGLTDSPSGLAAWIAEKFHRWTDNSGVPEDAISRDAMLANISLYWFTGAIGSSFWPYYSRLHRPWFLPLGETIKVPTGYVAFPREILRPPQSLAAKTYADIRRWTVMPKGGHFAALEQPEALADEIHAFFSEVAE
ncbi:MAG: epoxide hydrolase [Hyphomicrobium sp.]|nr:epoxide hydrolase [Hyphomicrobium sp.]MBN9267657.1 epoxide hydrolase [Hyphomicrobium sp.]